MTVNSIRLSDETIRARRALREERLSQTAEQRTRAIRAERAAERQREAFKSFFSPRHV